MTVVAQYLRYRQNDSLGARAVGIKSSPDFWMLDTSGEGYRESLRISNSACVVATPVRKVAGGEAVDPGLAPFWVELGGIFQVPHSTLVHFFGDPAFVTDVGVPVALVEGDDYSLDLG